MGIFFTFEKDAMERVRSVISSRHMGLCIYIYCGEGVKRSLVPHCAFPHPHPHRPLGWKADLVVLCKVLNIYSTLAGKPRRESGFLLLRWVGGEEVVRLVARLQTKRGPLSLGSESKVHGMHEVCIESRDKKKCLKFVAS